MKYIKSYIIISLLLITTAGISQEKAWSVQLSAGPTIHYGDIMDHELFFPATDNSAAWNFSGSLSLEKQFNPYLGLRGQILYGKLGGTRYTVTNPRYFEADIFDYSLQARLSFVNLFADYNPYRTIDFYGLAGVGMSNWESHLKDDTDNIIRSSGGVDVGMIDMTTEGFIPVGAGFSIRMNDNFDLNLESTLRITNSDLLDAAEGGSAYDMYSYTSLGFTYTFGSRKAQRRTRIEESTHRIQQEETDTTEQQEQEEETPPFEAEITSEMPEEINAGQSFAVNININKGDITGPATVRQVFPEGFEVQPLALSGGEYNFLNQVFTVNWQSLPSNKKIALTYRVKTDDVEGGTYPISGIFTYTQNANSKLLPFKNSVKVNAPVRSEEEKQDTYDQQRVDEGTVFRVQIRAKYHKKMSIPALKSQFDINETIYEDYHGGYYIYTLGNFSTYDAAKRKRENLTRVHGVKDAFVVAFVNGRRVNKLSDLEQFK